MTRMALFLCMVAVTGGLAQLIPGGYTETRKVDRQTRKIVITVKRDIVSWLGDKYIRIGEFKPLLYRSQVVAGTNYLVKISIGYGRYIHVIIYRHFSGNPTQVTGIQTGKTLTDPLETF
uniref:Cystatin domain-containing protein n=1 Tax=Magallana gigas TaxID=29159 RepID=A0A8W8J838_MAGGI|nr:cystatin-A [Crassostrea gigas]